MKLNKMKALEIVNEMRIFQLTTSKFESFYNSIDEMLYELKHVYVPKNNEEIQIVGIYKGFNYIHGFAKQLRQGKNLSEKQITQCKKLAVEIKKAYLIRKSWYL
jgi:hypothetical protein